jgi:murein DD-endopeptidase MepM/ murein hydrolase activator NlpD
MNINRTYSILVIRGTQVRRLVVSETGVRYLLWGGITLLCAGGWYFSDYIALQKKRVQETIAKAQAQQEKVSALRATTNEVQALLSRWKGFRERIQASLPRRHRAPSDLQHADEELHEVLTFLQSELAKMIASLPSDWPVKGRVVSGVGMRPSPWTGEIEFHSGLDIPKPIGTLVHAAGDAVVESVGETDGNGRTIVLNHGEGIKTQYAHLSKILVNKGDHVRRGERIAHVGNTGKSTGPHLHYEVRVNGIPVDPRKGLIAAGPGEQEAVPGP